MWECEGYPPNKKAPLPYNSGIYPPSTKNMEILTLQEIKEALGAENLRVVDSKNVDDSGVPCRGTVYHGNQKIGLVKKGLKYADLKEEEQHVVAVKNEELGWVFTIRSGGEL